MKFRKLVMYCAKNYISRILLMPQTILFIYIYTSPKLAYTLCLWNTWKQCKKIIPYFSLMYMVDPEKIGFPGEYED